MPAWSSPLTEWCSLWKRVHLSNTLERDKVSLLNTANRRRISAPEKPISQNLPSFMLGYQTQRTYGNICVLYPIIYLRQRRTYMWLPAMFVCLSVSKITQKCVQGFGWIFACRQVSGHGQTDKLLSPMRIIVRMPEPENLKDLSKSVKQAPHSEQATGHRTHCREILFTPRRIIQGPGSFLGRSTFLYDVRLCSYGASNCRNFRILAFVGVNSCRGW